MYVFEFSTSIANIILSSYLVFTKTFHFADSVVLHQKAHLFSI